jgi:hypothetical protein
VYVLGPRGLIDQLLDFLAGPFGGWLLVPEILRGEQGAGTSEQSNGEGGSCGGMAEEAATAEVGAAWYSHGLLLY